MAGRDDSVTWLRVKDEDIHEAEQLRVTVSAVEKGCLLYTSDAADE